MPRSKQRNVVRICGSHLTKLTTITNGSSQYSFNLFPETSFLGTRANTISDNFRLYRFTRVKVSIAPDGEVGKQVIWVPGYTTINNFTSPQDMSEVQRKVISLPGDKHIRHLELNRADLKGYIDWYCTDVSGPDTSVNYQGSFFIGAFDSTGLGVALATCIYIEYDLELKDPLEAGDSKRLPRPPVILPPLSRTILTRGAPEEGEEWVALDRTRPREEKQALTPQKGHFAGDGCPKPTVKSLDESVGGGAHFRDKPIHQPRCLCRSCTGPDNQSSGKE